MTKKIVELILRFWPMSCHSEEWDFLMPGPGWPQRRHEIGGEFRVLIIADPGAGKTFEAQTRARRINYLFHHFQTHRFHAAPITRANQNR